MATRHIRAMAHAALFVALLGAMPAIAAQDGAPPVSVTKTVFPNPVRAGEQVTWTLRILNTSPAAIANVRVADVLPSGINEIQASGPGFGCTVSGLKVSCLAKELPIGISLVSITGRAKQAEASASSAPSVAARTGTVAARSNTITARSQVPDGIMDTVANLKLTIGALEKEKVGLSKELTDMTAQKEQTQKQVLALSAELETARVSRSDTAASLAAVADESKELQATIATTQAERDQMAADLKTSAIALAAAQAELATTKQSLDAKSAELAKVALELTSLRGTLVMAEPLSFAVDCPVEATSQKWLLNNLPFLLDDAMDNPTPRNTRAFLCAQRAATSNDGFTSARRYRSSVRVPAPMAAPATQITDGKLHTHHQFTTAPTATEISEMRAAAESGSVEALNDWGVLVLMGVGTAQNVDLGRQYISSAANKGSSIAAFNLAVVFELGVGVDPNRATASQWRRVATATNNNRG